MNRGTYNTPSIYNVHFMNRDTDHESSTSSFVTVLVKISESVYVKPLLSLSLDFSRKLPDNTHLKEATRLTHILTG